MSNTTLTKAGFTTAATVHTSSKTIILFHEILTDFVFSETIRV